MLATGIAGKGTAVGKETTADATETYKSVQTLQSLREAALRLETTLDSVASSAKRRSRRNSSLIAGDKVPEILVVDRFG